MALQKIGRGMLNTGVSDSSDATAITISSGEVVSFANETITDGNGSTGGVTVSDGLVKINTGTGSVAAVDFYCEVNNAHRVKLKAPAHSDFSGNVDVTLPNYTSTLIGTNSSGRVGIGTSNPKTDLDVSSSTGGILTLTSSDTTGAANQLIGKINFYNSDASGDGPQNSVAISAHQLASIGNGGYLSFATTTGDSGSEGADPTERMRIDHDGQVGINETAPQAWLDIGTTHGVAKEVALRITNADYPNYGWEIWRDNTTGHLNFAHEDAGTSSTRVTFEAGGNVGISQGLSHNSTNACHYFGSTKAFSGVNPAIGRAGGTNYHITGSAAGDLCIGGEAGNSIIFGTSASGGPTEKMRINSGGGVNIGTTSGANNGGVISEVADNDTSFYARGSNGRVNIKFHTEATGGRTWYFRTGGTAHFGSGGGDLLVLNEAGNAIMTWDYSGSRINGDFNDTSDVSLKENIVDITDGITKIKALKPRTFDWKEKNKPQKTNGFIAQEVETVLPNDVVGDNYDSDNPEHGSKAINTSGLLAVAVKAIQEQQTIIDNLKSRIETLEG